MKLTEAIIMEAPLPDSWDGDIYDERVSFKQRIEYAKARAEQVGSGSSRVAFVIPYKGRKTVLKISKNRKGSAQSALEADILSDGFHGNRGITIPLIDYDERNSYPTWIHTEFAEKVRSVKHLEQLMNQFNSVATPASFSIDNLFFYLHEMQGGSRGMFGRPTDEQYETLAESEFVGRLTELVMDFDLAIGDLIRASNWGVYKGNPVLIDIGASNQVITQYYGRR